MCILYSSYARYFLIQGHNITLFRLKNQKKYLQREILNYKIYNIFNQRLDLTHYWPIAGSESKELIASKDLYGASSMSFVSDRFGNQGSAFKLVSGFFQAPVDFYFGETFTILAWVKLNDHLTSQRLLDFGNGAASNNIVVSLSGYGNRSYFHNYYDNLVFSMESTSVLELNVWHHVAFSTEPGKMYIFINGILDNSHDTNGQPSSKNITRNINYFGKSSWADPNAKMEYDDIKFFNRALKPSEINDEYLYGSLIIN